ncbi:hypothetical protein M0804_002258 [Polistes exclamans]|nr:hypothetical protein M0804_002258 [Polistes exclamans]
MISDGTHRRDIELLMVNLLNDNGLSDDEDEDDEVEEENENEDKDEDDVEGGSALTDKASLKIISRLKDPQLEASQQALLVKPGDSSDLEERP